MKLGEMANLPVTQLDGVPKEADSDDRHSGLSTGSAALRRRLQNRINQRQSRKYSANGRIL